MLRGNSLFLLLYATSLLVGSFVRLTIKGHSFELFEKSHYRNKKTKRQKKKAEEKKIRSNKGIP